MNIRFLTTIIISIFVLALAQSDIQNLGQLENFYDFYGDAIVDDVFSFTSHTEAEEIVSRIMKHTGLNTNFNSQKLQCSQCNCPNSQWRTPYPL